MNNKSCIAFAIVGGWLVIVGVLGIIRVIAATPEIKVETDWDNISIEVEDTTAQEIKIDADSGFDPNALGDAISGLITTIETAQGVLEWDDKEYWRIQLESAVFVNLSVYCEDGKGGEFTVEDGNLVFRGDVASTLQAIYEHFCKLPNSYHTKEDDDNGYDPSKPILINPPEGIDAN